MTNSWTFEDVDLVGLDIVASRLALALRPGDAVTLSGPLGAGKTTFARALVGRLGGEGEVPSPTFALMQRYETPRLVLPIATSIGSSRASSASSVSTMRLRRCGSVRMARAGCRLVAGGPPRHRHGRDGDAKCASRRHDGPRQLVGRGCSGYAQCRTSSTRRPMRGRRRATSARRRLDALLCAARAAASERHPDELAAPARRTADPRRQAV